MADDIIKQQLHKRINARENRRGNTEWTILRNRQDWAQGTEQRPTNKQKRAQNKSSVKPGVHEG